MVKVGTIKRYVYDFAVFAGLALCAAALVLYPRESVGAAKNGLTL